MSVRILSRFCTRYEYFAKGARKAPRKAITARERPLIARTRHPAVIGAWKTANQAKPDRRDVQRPSEAETGCRAKQRRPINHRAPAPHLARPLTDFAERIVKRSRRRRIARQMIVLPLVGVSEHAIDHPRIRPLLPDRMRRAARVVAVPGDRFEVRVGPGNGPGGGWTVAGVSSRARQRSPTREAAGGALFSSRDFAFYALAFVVRASSRDALDGAKRGEARRGRATTRALASTRFHRGYCSCNRRHPTTRRCPRYHRCRYCRR